MLPFITDSGSWAVAAEYLHFVGQYHQSGMDTVHQRIKIAAGQIGTANAAVKQYIATQYKLLGFAVKTDATGTMAGRKQYFQHVFTQCNGIAFF